MGGGGGGGGGSDTFPIGWGKVGQYFITIVAMVPIGMKKFSVKKKE